MADGARFEGVHCTMTIEEPAPAVVIVAIDGTDVGELGDAPFRALAPLIERDDGVELFIDARRARGASIDVSAEWAQWLSRHRDALRRVSMLTPTRLVQLTASFVRRFAELGDRMRVYTEPALFDDALSSALADACAPREG